MDEPTDIGYRGNGIFFMNSAVRFGDITDGTTNTFLIAEVQDDLRGEPNSNRMPGSDRKYNFASGSDGNPPTDVSEYLVGMEADDPINANTRDANGHFSNDGEYALGAITQGAAILHWAMDRSALYLRTSNMTTYRALASRNGGEVIGGDY